jgi:hypothetical protein
MRDSNPVDLWKTKVRRAGLIKFKLDAPLLFENDFHLAELVHGIRTCRLRRVGCWISGLKCGFKLLGVAGRSALLRPARQRRPHGYLPR